jgi:Cu/Ag efflux protein CusF
VTNKRVIALCGHFLVLGLLGIAVSCASDKKEESKAADASKASADRATGASGMTYTPGVAGGTLDETITGTATVAAIDKTSRKVTLTTQDGKASFTAPPEMQNFDQLKVGDKVTATLHEKLVIFVDEGRDPAAVHAATLSRAPKGAKPGAIAAESFEVVSTVKSIDQKTRVATLQFVDGQTRAIKVRPDVDLSKYKVGDSVVIRITQQLTLLAEKP